MIVGALGTTTTTRLDSWVGQLVLQKVDPLYRRQRCWDRFSFWRSHSAMMIIKIPADISSHQYRDFTEAIS